MKINTILLFGAPGSGKGTQGHILGAIPGYVHVACGDVFRNLRAGSALGKIFLDYSSRGELVPDDFTIQLWKEHIDGMISLKQLDPATDILVLDGIPRNIAQAGLLDEHINVKRIYYLECLNLEIMFYRLKKRALHENRLDDASDEVIHNRLELFTAETSKVLSYYPDEIIARVDSGRKPIEVLSDILNDIRSH